MTDLLPNRIDKALAWLTRSRNIWKEKCQETKLLLKRQTFAAKRLKEGRNVWKLSCIRLKQELIKSKETISNLQRCVQDLESQIQSSGKGSFEIKKKPSTK